MRAIKIIILFSICCVFAGTVFADSVTLKTGKKINCKIISENDDYIVIESKLVTLKLYRFELTAIEKGEPQIPVFVESADDESGNLTVHEPEQGIATPAVLPESDTTNVIQQVPSASNATAAPAAGLSLNASAALVVPPAVIVMPGKAVAGVPRKGFPILLSVIIVIFPLAAAIFLPLLLKNSALDSRARRDYSRSRGSQHLKQIEEALPFMNRRLAEFKDEEKAAGQDEAKLGKLRRDADTLDKLIQMVIAEKNKLQQVKASHFARVLRTGGKGADAVNAYVMGIYPPWLEPPKWFKITTEKYGSQESDKQ